MKCFDSSAALKSDGMDNCCGLGGYKCKEGEGDCDNDSDCAGNLICGKDNCLKGISSWLPFLPSFSTYDSTDDCCVKPT